MAMPIIRYNCQICGNRAKISGNKPLKCKICKKILCRSCFKNGFCKEHFDFFTDKEKCKLRRALNGAYVGFCTCTILMFLALFQAFNPNLNFYILFATFGLIFFILTGQNWVGVRSKYAKIIDDDMSKIINLFEDSYEKRDMIYLLKGIPIFYEDNFPKVREKIEYYKSVISTKGVQLVGDLRAKAFIKRIDRLF